MKSADGLESTLNELLVKNVPYQIPENGRKWIATNLWLLELIFVVLGAFAFIGLLGLLGLTSAFATATGLLIFAGYELLLAWLALLVLGAEVLVGAFAVPKLRAMSRAGWNLAYWVALFSVVYGVANALARADIFSLISQLVFSALGLYILFQVRSYFKG